MAMAYGYHYPAYYPGGVYGTSGYLHQQNWPSVYAPGFQSTCWGCRVHKRSAEPEPEAHAPLVPVAAVPVVHHAKPVALAAHPGAATSYVYNSPWGLPAHPHPLGKRSAEPDAHYYGGYHYGPGIAHHPTGTSYVGRTVFGYPSRYNYGYRGYYGHYY